LAGPRGLAARADGIAARLRRADRPVDRADGDAPLVAETRRAAAHAPAGRAARRPRGPALRGAGPAVDDRAAAGDRLARLRGTRTAGRPAVLGDGRVRGTDLRVRDAAGELRRLGYARSGRGAGDGCLRDRRADGGDDLDAVRTVPARAGRR